MKRRNTILQQTIKKLLREADEADADASSNKTEASLDAQVDKLLVQYESEAKTTKSEGFDFRMMTRRFLNEADDDKDASKDDESKMSLDDIDMNSFVNGVVRLIENYDSLLEVKNTLVRRAKSFLKKSYSADAVAAFEDLMRDEHSIVDGMSKEEVKDEDFQPPDAARAGGGGGGGGVA